MKRVLGIMFASGGVLILWPVMIVVAFLILLCDRQHPLFSQTRVGLHKTSFIIHKFRTMRNEQITFLGRILRKTGLDELPQMWNILRGDMAFVGPRPLTSADITRLGWDASSFSSRWTVPPGITGLAQFAKICDKDLSWQLDQEYIQNHTIGRDLQIFFCSFLVPILGKETVKKLL